MKMLVNIDVPDLAAATKFYESAVGLTLRRIIDGDVAEMVGASSVVYLLQKEAGSAAHSGGAASVREFSRHWTPVHVDFVVKDVREASKQAIRAGARQESECVEWMGSKCITLSDPFGNGFCFIEFAEETYRASPA